MCAHALGTASEGDFARLVPAQRGHFVARNLLELDVNGTFPSLRDLEKRLVAHVEHVPTGPRWVTCTTFVNDLHDDGGIIVAARWLYRLRAGTPDGVTTCFPAYRIVPICAANCRHTRCFAHFMKALAIISSLPTRAIGARDIPSGVVVVVAVVASRRGDPLTAGPVVMAPQGPVQRLGAGPRPGPGGEYKPEP